MLTLSRGRKNILAAIFTGVAILTTLAILFLGWQGYQIERSEIFNIKSSLEFEQLIGQIIYFDEALTMSARMAVETGNLAWEQRYETFKPKLDEAINRFFKMSPRTYGIEPARKINQSNIALVDMEEKALALAREGKRDAARTILNGVEYQNNKRKYSESVHELRRLSTGAQYLEHLRNEVIYLDELLTMSARMAVVTGNPDWEQRYLSKEPELEKSISEVITVIGEAYISGKEQTEAANTRLAEMEREAFTLVRQGNLSAAQEILFGKKYEQQKRIYKEGIEEVSKFLTHKTNQGIVQKEQEIQKRLFLFAGMILVTVASLYVFFTLLFAWQSSVLKFLEHNPNPVLGISKDCIVLYRNQAGKFFLESMACDVGSRLPPLWHELVYTTLDTGQRIEKEMSINEIFYLCACIPGPGKKSIYLYAKDITQLRTTNMDMMVNQEKMKIMYRSLNETHEELKKAKDKLIHSEKLASLGQFSAGVAHEVKNPLAVILLSVDEIDEDEHDLRPQSRKHLEMIKRAADKANHVVHELLVFSRSTQVKFENLDLHRIVDSAVMLSRTKTKFKDIDIRLELSADSQNMVADSAALEHIFVNLITNAADAIEMKGEIGIKTLCRQSPTEGRSIIIEVSDTGCGMSPEMQSKIFDPFFTTKEQGKGTGLGLSTVYSLVELHKGTLSVSSQPQQGTTFTIEFPQNGKIKINQEQRKES